MAPATSRALNGPHLFSFVVVADTHINEADGDSTSPYQTNRLANVRARHVFLDIAAMDPPPKFVVHLGDIVHPVPSLPTFAAAVACFKEISSPVTVPVHLVPGNHDVGDKCVDWMPAEQVCEPFLETYRAAFGSDYFAFDQGNLRFVIINSLLLNSGLADEACQKEWLERQLSEAQGKRVFLFMHYPPYIYHADERGNYDNIDEPGRSWLLEIMRKPQVEAVFAGHVHNFWYDRVGDAELYMLPSTAFLRHDFTEFYRTTPDVEFGRGDVEKFGYFIVDVFADGHVAYSVRTMGAQADAGTKSIAAPVRHLAHPKTSTFDNIGVELRHPWAESMQISATGGVQEFGRKWARNDYPLLALWEMGVRLSKVPDLDLTEPESRERMRLLAKLGHRYIVTSIGAPKSTLLSLDMASCGVIGIEVNATLETFERQRESLHEIRRTKGVQIYYSKILTPDLSRYDGKQFSHFIQSGFTPDELKTYEEFITSAIHGGDINGITVRIEADQALVSPALELMEFHQKTACLILVSLKLSGPSVSIERADDRANVASVAQAMVLSKASPGICYIYDTFMDVDRGYFPRHAFIDRHFNPRIMAKAYTTLTALLSNSSAIALEEAGTSEAGSLEFQSGSDRYLLVCASAAVAANRMRKLPATCTVYDLPSGRKQTFEAEMKALEDIATTSPQELQILLALLE